MVWPYRYYLLSSDAPFTFCFVYFFCPSNDCCMWFYRHYLVVERYFVLLILNASALESCTSRRAWYLYFFFSKNISLWWWEFLSGQIVVLCNMWLIMRFNIFNHIVSVKLDFYILWFIWCEGKERMERERDG